MNELTIEQKAKRYDEAIEIARKIENGELINVPDGTHIPVAIFPELKELNDERIRKELLEHCKNQAEPYTKTGNECPQIQSWITWLEKQSKKKSGECSDCYIETNFSKQLDTWFEKGKCSGRDEVIFHPEKFGLQKLVEKSESKFKVGDIITNGEIIGEIDENKNNKYHGWFGYNKNSSTYYADIPDIENWHLWTIKDAKAGDVLASKDSPSILIFKNLDTDTRFSSYYNIQGMPESGWSNACFIPATKKQCDLLFQKMKEAGYEWDADKKELKEIKKQSKKNLQNNNFRRMFEQNLSWSEEDEKMFNDICIDIMEYVPKSFEENSKKVNWFKSLKERVLSQPKQEWSEEDKNRFMNLISLVKCSNENNATKAGFIEFIYKLRSQNCWKPSNEQLESLRCVNEAQWSNVKWKEIKSLYNDLKKL